MRDLLIFGLFAVLAPLTLVHPYIGGLAWVFHGLFNPQGLAWGAARSFPFGMVIVILTFAGMLLTRDERSFKGGAAAIVLAIFTLWACVTTWYALTPDQAVPYWTRVMKINIMTLTLLFLLNTRRHVDLLVWIIVGSIGFYGVKGGVFTISTGGHYMVLGPEQSVIEGNNALAIAIVMVIPLLAHLYHEYQNRWIRLGLLGSILLCVAAVLGSWSRGAFLAVAAMGAFLWMRSSHKVPIMIVGTLVVLALVPFMPEQWESRMRTIETYEEDGSAMGRIYAWQTATNVAKDRILGGGFEYQDANTAAKYSPINSTAVAHSIYFQVLGTQGFIGLGLYLLFWGLVWHQCAFVRRASRNHPTLSWAHSLSSMTQVSLVGYAVGGAFLDLAFWDMPYYLWVGMVVTSRLVRQALATAEAIRDVGVDTPTSMRERVLGGRRGQIDPYRQ